MSFRCLIKVLSIYEYFANNYTFWWYQVHLLSSCRLVKHGLFCLLTNLSNKTPYQRSSSTKKMGNQLSEKLKIEPLAVYHKSGGGFSTYSKQPLVRFHLQLYQQLLRLPPNNMFWSAFGNFELFKSLWGVGGLSIPVIKQL